MKNEMNKKNSPIATLSNKLAFNLTWNLSYREWNVVLFLISKLDSKNQKNFDEQLVSIKELKDAIKTGGNKWGSLYKEINDLCDGLLSKPISFYSDVFVEDKPLRGGVNFFEMIAPERGYDGTVYLRFKFTRSVKPLLLELNKQFVQIPQSKTKLIKNGHAIRFLIAAKAKRDMMRNYEAISSMKYGIEQFKSFLGIKGKYMKIVEVEDKKGNKKKMKKGNFKELNRAVIQKIKQEINKNCDFLEIVEVKLYPEKGRPKTAVEFLVADKNNENPQQLSFFLNEDWQPSENDIESLSSSELRAYYLLVEFGVTPGIAYRQILPKTKSSSEFFGFEDWYIEELFIIFNKKTKKKKSDVKGRIGAFVNWVLGTDFTKHQFSEVMERISKRKILLEQKDINAWNNRLYARTMTASEFKEYYSKEQKKIKTKSTNSKTENEIQNTFKGKLGVGNQLNLEQWKEENPAIFEAISEEQRKEVEQSLKDLGGVEVKNKEEMITNRIEMAIRKYYEAN